MPSPAVNVGRRERLRLGLEVGDWTWNGKGTGWDFVIGLQSSSSIDLEPLDGLPWRWFWNI